MIKEEFRRIVSLSISIAALIVAIRLLVFKQEITATNVMKAISIAISATTLFWTFYIYYGWKLCLLDKIFYRPNLNGTWIGVFESDWKDLEGNLKGPMPFSIVIRQSFIRIHFTTFTETFVGVSYAETFSLNKDTGLKNIAYLYRKDTSQNNDEELREGATELRLIISDAQKKLEGKFWTNTKTQGIISVEFLNRNQVDCFEDVKKLTANE